MPTSWHTALGVPSGPAGAHGGAPLRQLDRLLRCAHLCSDGLAMVRWLILLGIMLIVAGLLWPWLTRLGLGRLPGDIVIERDNFRLYIPLATSVVISVVLSLVLWLLDR